MGNTMTRLQRFGLGLLLAYCAYSAHFIYLLHRTSSVCEQTLNDTSNHHELLGAQRICSAAGVDTTAMLKTLWPQTPRRDAGQAQ
jgi:hypothetical protein